MTNLVEIYTAAKFWNEPFFKKIKQLKVREESSDIKEDLPLRLRVFEKFPERPLMTKLNRIPSDFATPKVRDSFLTKFVNDTKEHEELMEDQDSSSKIKVFLIKLMSEVFICANLVLESKSVFRIPMQVLEV